MLTSRWMDEVAAKKRTNYMKKVCLLNSSSDSVCTVKCVCVCVREYERDKERERQEDRRWKEFMSYDKHEISFLIC